MCCYLFRPSLTHLRIQTRRRTHTHTLLRHLVSPVYIYNLFFPPYLRPLPLNAYVIITVLLLLLNVSFPSKSNLHVYIAYCPSFLLLFSPCTHLTSILYSTLLVSLSVCLSACLPPLLSLSLWARSSSHPPNQQTLSPLIIFRNCHFLHFSLPSFGSLIYNFPVACQPASLPICHDA